jgi:hypothetical protein
MDARLEVLGTGMDRMLEPYAEASSAGLVRFLGHRAGPLALKSRNRFRIFKAWARIPRVFVRRIERLLNDQASGLKHYRVAGSRGRAGHCFQMSRWDRQAKLLADCTFPGPAAAPRGGTAVDSRVAPKPWNCMMKTNKQPRTGVALAARPPRSMVR